MERMQTSLEMNYLSIYLTKTFRCDEYTQSARKDTNIYLSNVNSAAGGKVSYWKVQQEVYLKTDHNLVSFEYGKSQVESKWERLDFKNADWSKCKNKCGEQIEEWLGTRRLGNDLNEDHESFVGLLKQIT